MSYSRRRKMMNRPSYQRNTGRRGKLFFLNSPTDGRSAGRSQGASFLRRKIKDSKSWEALRDLLKEGIEHALGEPSLFGAAAQTCGNKGWCEGFLELHQLWQDEGIKLDIVLRNIALDALSHLLKPEGKYGIDRHRADTALEMAKWYWQEIVAQDAANFNIGLCSSLKLATCLDCHDACIWALSLWSESREAQFPKNHITYSAYINFLEHYQQYDEVDALLESSEPDVSRALNCVLLGSLLNCSAARGNWQRAEALWDFFMQKKVEPNIMCQNARAKVYLLAGQPAKACVVYEDTHTILIKSFRYDFRAANEYAQACLILCHSSLDPSAIKRLQQFLKRSLKKGPKGNTSIREQLEKMKDVADKLSLKPEELNMRDILIDWKARELSVMAKWKNFKAGSQYV